VSTLAHDLGRETHGGIRIRRVDLGVGHGCGKVAFLANGKGIVTGSKRGAVTLWDFDAGKQRLLGSHAGEVRGLVVSPDGRWAVSCAADGASVWELATGALRLSLPDEQGYFSAAFSPKGDLLALGSGSWSLRVWDVSSFSKPAAK
jgi:WD40 repeat protein